MRYKKLGPFTTSPNKPKEIEMATSGKSKPPSKVEAGKGIQIEEFIE